MEKVRHLWEYLMPFATDSTGVCSFFCDADAVVIGMDPGATAVRCYPFTERRDDRKAQYKGMQIGERDAVMGKLDESLDRLQMLIERDEAEQIVLVGSPASSLLGVDLKALARRLEKIAKTDTYGFSTTGNRYYDEGLEQAFRAVYEKLVRRNPEKTEEYRSAALQNDQKQRNRVNLLGMNTLDYPEETLRKQLREHLERQSFQIMSIWGMKSGRENWEHLFEAEQNVICSASGYRLAERIRKETGMPYVFLDEFLEQNGGLELVSDGLEIPESAERILILGEQVRSGLLRRAIRDRSRKKGRNVPEIMNAGFFTMHKSMREEGDQLLKSETALQQLVSEGKFDLVIGDPMFRLLMSPSQSYLSQIHPPVSGSFAGQFAV